MRNFSPKFTSLSFAAVVAGAMWAALPQALAQDALDEVSQKASKLEAELGKVRDSSPEAAPVMLELVDLYHANGRALGLVRIGQKFVNSQASSPRHKDVMIKLIDGLAATSRNKETVAICRQFLSRYPQDGQCAAIEVVLARTLDQEPDRKAAADAHAAIFKRQGGNPQGKESGARAVWLYSNLNSKEGFVAAGDLGERLMDATNGEFATHVGWQSMYWWHRAGEWAKSNLAANKLLKKAPPTDKGWLVQIHQHMASNSANLGQRTNAVASWQAIRQLGDNEGVLRSLITEMHHAQMKPNEMEGLVNEYWQKHGDRQERFQLKSLLAHAYLRAGDKPRAVALFAEVLPFDARSHEAAAYYAREIGTEINAWNQAEGVLRDALGKNPKDASFIRWVLAIDLYRDRIKDNGKSKQMLRELMSQSPSNDGHTQHAIHWLLSNPADDNEFNAFLNEHLASRAAHLDWPAHRNFLAEWINGNKPNKDLKARVETVQKAVANANNQEAYKDWTTAESQNQGQAQQARTKLLTGTVNDEQAWNLYRNLAENYRHNGSNEQRARAVPIYAAMAKRFPQSPEVAQWNLEVATDYGTPEAAKEASLHMLAKEAAYNNGDAWRRLMGTADRLKDAALAKQAFDWLNKSQAKFGIDPNSASHIGDVLEKYEMKNEALDYWKKMVAANRDSYESRQAAERVVQRLKGPERTQYLNELFAAPSQWHGAYAMWIANDFLAAKDLGNFAKIMAETRKRQNERPFTNWGIEEHYPQQWLDTYRGNKDATEADKRTVYSVIRDLRMGRPSAAAELALMELPPPQGQTPMGRLLACQLATTQVGADAGGWDRLMPYGQAAVARKDYLLATTLLSGMLVNVPQVDAPRKQQARDLITQSYSRIGGVGLTIDEKSPVAPLLQAALYLRLGDNRMAYDTYAANLKLFDAHRNEVPHDLILFVCESHIAAGGDENHDRAEDILRGWLVKNSEVPEIEATTKAAVQLLLARNYYRSQRFDVARSEFNTVINRYPGSPEAIEAEFGIGESFMAQKVYDQAEAVFEKLASSSNRDVVIRAEFLRGVLSSRRGDRDQARDIFKSVLERVPNVELANQALFNLAEVYGAEERYIDQLELLRTVGRLGRASKRWHTPGTSLSVVVQDSDLGISRGHAKIPVRITTEPGGDEEIIYLYSGGAGKGLFRADLETRLGQVEKKNKILELTGKDTIKCDYPDEFKAEFKNVPLADAEIKIAASAKFEAASGKIVDKEKETLSQRLEREQKEQEESDKRVSQNRPENQIKPGNIVYLRVQDADRDLADSVDKVMVKMVATSGDQVQVALQETGPHTGIFEGSIQTGELPAGALASDTAIDHSPLMAIDRDPKSAWVSEPDGATPKWLAVDMKDLKPTSVVTFASPDPNNQAPVRGYLEGSQDGRFWFRLGANPPEAPAEPIAVPSERMKQRVYAGNFTGFTTWKQIADLTKGAKPIEEAPVDQLTWSRDPNGEDAKKPFGVLWHGKIVQPKSGAARFAIQGQLTAMAVDGNLELPPGKNGRFVDVWLEKGSHDVTIFAAGTAGSQAMSATWAKSDHGHVQLTMLPFRAADFDLSTPDAKPAEIRARAKFEGTPGKWAFNFAPLELRHAKLVIEEYRGEAVSINQIEMKGPQDSQQYIPTQADVLTLATNNVLEIAAGDDILATYTDEFTPSAVGGNQLLTVKLTATYFNGEVIPIGYDFVKQPNGQVDNIRKQVIRIDPGERFIVEILDYDRDQSAAPDTLTFKVSVNDGPPVEFTATETEEYSGIFTKEVDTLALGKTANADGKDGPKKPAEPTGSDAPKKGGAAAPGDPKLSIKPGDRVLISYLDAQNTFPGHAVPRETTVFVNEPSEGKIRVIETRAVRPQGPKGPKGEPAPESKAPPVISYLPLKADKAVSDVAFEAPLTVEVIDRDAAKDSRSKVTVELTTTSGAKIPVECVVSPALSQGGGMPQNQATYSSALTNALVEGRFVGQVIMQLGSQNSPDLVPLNDSMPRNLIGGSPLPEDDMGKGGETLITRVLNLSGQDAITASYNDALRPQSGPQKLGSKARLISNGVMYVTDRDYVHPSTALHVGEKMFLIVTDADLDISDERDTAKVEITTDRGEKETVSLAETLAHSGIFTGAFMLKPNDKPTAGNLSGEEGSIEAYFGDKVTVKYIDQLASTESGKLEIVREMPVVIGTDGLVAAFSKTFRDEKIAVETQFHIAESYFELFKSHRKLGRGSEEKTDLEAGKRILREVMEDYPDPKYAPRIAYLLGQFAQELQQWDEAISSYQMIVRQFPDSTLAADAQYKLAQCYEEAGDFESALEAYVTLAATYPKSPLIANVMIRISEHFYREKQYDVAAQVGEKFLERFESHQYAPRMAFRVGQCYYKANEFVKAGSAFDKFAKIFPDDALCSDSLFWAGESFRMGTNNREAFRRYNRCRWDFPSSDAAKYARGRLALPAMLQQFEAEANSVDE